MQETYRWDLQEVDSGPKRGPELGKKPLGTSQNTSQVGAESAYLTGVRATYYRITQTVKQYFQKHHFATPLSSKRISAWLDAKMRELFLRSNRGHGGLHRAFVQVGKENLGAQITTGQSGRMGDRAQSSGCRIGARTGNAEHQSEDSRNSAYVP